MIINFLVILDAYLVLRCYWNKKTELVNFICTCIDYVQVQEFFIFLQLQRTFLLITNHILNIDMASGRLFL